MPICKNCNTPVEDNAKFCSNCGAKIVNNILCSKCKKEISSDSFFCEHCGASLSQKVSEKSDDIFSAKALDSMDEKNNTNVNIVQEQVPKQEKVLNEKKMPLKGFAYILIAVIAIVAAIKFLPDLFGSKSKIPEAVLYLKDGEINYSSLKNIEPIEITSDLYPDETSGTEDYYNAQHLTHLSEDGKTIFYPDRIKNNSSSLESISVTLYYKNVNSDEDGTKIDSNIFTYQINKKADKIFYLKNKSRDFYINDFSDKEKIDSDVNYFYINEDGSKIYYFTNNGDLYLKNGSDDKEKIDSDSVIKYITKDYNKIYYIKENKLFLKEIGKEKKEIVDEVGYIERVYETGEVYYTKQQNSELKLYDFVDDDMKLEDEKIQEPVRLIEPNSRNFDSWDEYNIAYSQYSKENEDYYKEKEKYDAKINRDNIRELLKSQDYSRYHTSLYYYDGNETILITDYYLQNYYCSKNTEKACKIIEKKHVDIGKIKMSAIKSYRDVVTYINSKNSETHEMCLLIKSTLTTIDNTTGTRFSLNNSKTKLYFLDEYNKEKEYAKLCEIEIKDDTLGHKNIYDEEVSSFNLIYGTDNLIHYKDVKDYSGDLYIEKNYIDSGVQISSVRLIPDSNSLVYIVDYDEQKQSGTLKMYNGIKSVKIEDEVHEFYPVNEKKIVYMIDFDGTKGDIYLYDGGEKIQKIDDDVTKIIPLISYMNCRVFY